MFVSNAITSDTSLFAAYMRRPSGVIATPFALFGKGAVPMTDSFAELISESLRPQCSHKRWLDCGWSLRRPCQWGANESKDA